MDDSLINLRPRKYQEEVFVQAQKENVIAALSTGSGKTYISTLLLKWICSLPSSKGKVVIFLVPQVALVEQQAEFISKQSSLRVSKLYGSVSMDFSDRTKWCNKFQQSDVFVMTAQVFYNILTHSLWKITEVSLLIIDECHHTRKNHPYNSIMRVYLATDAVLRPKIFGMTASPIWNAKDPHSALRELEANLDARTIGVRENISELDQHATRPVETIHEYASPPEHYDFHSPTLWACIHIFRHILERNSDGSWPEIERRYNTTHGNLGPYAASLFLYNEMCARMKRLANEPTLDNTEFVIVESILSEYSAFFEDDLLPVPLHWCTPKVQGLVKILLDHISPTFQAIIFVEQRQFAYCLSKVLPRIAELKGQVRCSDLVGQNTSSELKDQNSSRGESIKMFRNRAINVLIATSVAEEGLDFPACDMVVRFDPLRHMVGYVQSRGRARNATSKFVVMVPKDDPSFLKSYNQLNAAEPKLKQLVNARYDKKKLEVDEIDDDDEDGMVDPADLAAREEYVVQTTGAFANYDNAIGLIEHMCSLIPPDKYATSRQPKYTITANYRATLRLPSRLPLASRDLAFTSLTKCSKREAKRAAAFMAVKRLHELEVFDDYLLPAGSRKKGYVDADGYHIPSVEGIFPVMDILVKDPWVIGDSLWLSLVNVGGNTIAGLITGTPLPTVALNNAEQEVQIVLGSQLELDGDEEGIFRLKLMCEFTSRMIWLRNTSKPLAGKPSLYLVPLTKDLRPDYDAMDRFLSHPYGNPDWTGIGTSHYDCLLVMERNSLGRTLLLCNIRNDLTLDSKPPSEPPYGDSPTYLDFFMSKWERRRARASESNRTWTPHRPLPGPLLEVTKLSPSNSGRYSLLSTSSPPSIPAKTPLFLVAQGSTGWFDVPWQVCEAYRLLPSICHRLTDVYRVSKLRLRLGLPAISENLLIEALTLPNCGADYSNQRMETLGDAVLELCTTVHLFNKYPWRHEGQLTNLRQSTLSNRYLLYKAKQMGVDMYVTSEVQSVRTWRYVLSKEEGCKREVLRQFPRRGLQDCMEAVLGAAFVTGGIPMALEVGTAMTLAFGGSVRWADRYNQRFMREANPLFAPLETSLGYSFQNHNLLREAITHPSFPSESPSYERLEFLGDAILDLVVIHHLYDRYPNATSHQLAFPRTKAVCSPALAYLAVRLGLHKILLINNVELSKEIAETVSCLEDLSPQEVVQFGWRLDPPKCLSDVVESVVGAILIDSHYDYEKTAGIVEFILNDILQELSPQIPRDPVSELTINIAQRRCRLHPIFAKSGEAGRVSVQAELHGQVVAGPIISTSASVAKAMAAERALSRLMDPDGPFSLDQICDCRDRMEVDSEEEKTEDEDADADVSDVEAG